MDELTNALRALPHGASFLFLDSVESLEAGHQGLGHYRIRGDEAFLEGHFPGQPIMPGVLLIEAIAQLGGVVAQSDPSRPPLADLRLAAVRNAKILGAGQPGDTLEIRASVSGRLGALLEIDGEVRRGEELLAKAKVTLAGQVLT